MVSSESPKIDNKTLGERGEEQAVAYLKGEKFAIVERNYRCKSGEIDIVAKDGKTLVFVEVKTRRNELFGPPQLAVTRFKQRQLSKAALTWLAKNNKHNSIARFDVVAILLREDQTPEINHIRDAFELAY